MTAAVHPGGARDCSGVALAQLECSEHATRGSGLEAAWAARADKHDHQRGVLARASARRRREHPEHGTCSARRPRGYGRLVWQRPALRQPRRRVATGAALWRISAGTQCSLERARARPHQPSVRARVAFRGLKLAVQRRLGPHGAGAVPHWAPPQSIMGAPTCAWARSRGTSTRTSSAPARRNSNRE